MSGTLSIREMVNQAAKERQPINTQADVVELSAQGHLDELERLGRTYSDEYLRLQILQQAALEAAVRTMKWMVANEARIKAAMNKDAQ